LKLQRGSVGWENAWGAENIVKEFNLKNPTMRERPAKGGSAWGRKNCGGRGGKVIVWIPKGASIIWGEESQLGGEARNNKSRGKRSSQTRSVQKKDF